MIYAREHVVTRWEFVARSLEDHKRLRATLAVFCIVAPVCMVGYGAERLMSMAGEGASRVASALRARFGMDPEIKNGTGDTSLDWGGQPTHSPTNSQPSNVRDDAATPAVVSDKGNEAEDTSRACVASPVDLSPVTTRLDEAIGLFQAFRSTHARDVEAIRALERRVDALDASGRQSAEAIKRHEQLSGSAIASLERRVTELTIEVDQTRDDLAAAVIVNPPVRDKWGRLPNPPKARR